tara:strand:+ start:646 stop:867 length:222 start_codon:yes stop_codon:yes gene_type:complete
MSYKILTELENQVLQIISKGDWFNEAPSECFENIMDEFKGNKNQLKGVLSSLFKKELILEAEYPNGMTAYGLR